MKNFRNQPLEPAKPLVTVGILSYNYEQFIAAALHSVLTQTYHNIELIIIDDCSTDNCPKIITDWIKQNNINCLYLQHQQNAGITQTSNEIVSHATGKYITFFATDDIMLPERIAKQAAILEDAGEEYGMCYANAQTIDEHDNNLGFYSNKQVFPEEDILEAFLNKEVSFATPTLLLSKSVFDKTGLFDTRVLIEDYNFLLRLLAIYKVKYCAYPCLIYRQKVSTQSIIHQHMAQNNAERHYHDRIISNHQALAFVKHASVRATLINNITKALRNLAYSNSQYYFKMLFFLLFNGYWHIPVRTVFSKLRQQLK